MRSTLHMRHAWRPLLGLVVAATLSACAPVAVTIDNPKSGDAVSLVPGQTLQLRMNGGGDKQWVWRTSPIKSLAKTSEGISPGTGAAELKTFEFAAVSHG